MDSELNTFDRGDSENVAYERWNNLDQNLQEEQEKQPEKAEIHELGDGVFRVEGILSEENLAEINERRNNATYILDNTAGLTSDLLGQVKPQGVFFSVKGGLDYDNIGKYDTDIYRERTMMSPMGLRDVVKYFEHVESEIDPDWDDLKKAMYVYGCLAQDMDCVDEKEKNWRIDEEVYDPRVVIRNLNGVLYNNLVCAGYAFTLQEMMTRVGVESHYCNQKGVHDYNVISIDGKNYGVDVTWDSSQKDKHDGQCAFVNFGRDPNFYRAYGHRNYNEDKLGRRKYDREEQRYELSTLEDDEYRDAYDVVSVRLKERTKVMMDLAEQPRETQEKYLPIDTIREGLVREARKDFGDYACLTMWLRGENPKIDPRLIDAFEERNGYVFDVAEWSDVFHHPTYGEKELGELREIDQDKRDGKAYDSARRAELIENLSQQLEWHMTRYAIETYDNIDEIMDRYENNSKDMDYNRKIASVNNRTRMQVVLGAKDVLIENGVPAEDIEEVCARINEKLNQASSEQEPEMSKREHDLDFLSAILPGTNLRADIELAEGRKISDDEFEQKRNDKDYVLGIIYPRLTEEYEVTPDEIMELLNK